jgi:hypothetical protein
LGAESFAAGLQAEYRIANAALQEWPYPHFYARDVFPRDFYAELQRNLPEPSALPSLESSGRTQGVRGRYAMKLGEDRLPGVTEAQHRFWRRLALWAFGGRFGSLVLDKFGAALNRRLKDTRGMEISDELLLVNDRTGYRLGPHTDSPTKVVSLLFYLPADERFAQHGTSIYLPKDPGFTCEGGPHYDFGGFDRLVTMPFVPNSVLGFAKSDHSFHGVELIVEPGVQRWLLLYDLRLRSIEPLPGPASGPKPLRN